jgi:hypothetical protein
MSGDGSTERTQRRARARFAETESAHGAPEELNPTGHAEAMLQDIARVFRHLGVQALRASVVNMFSNDFRSTWSINDAGAVSVGDADRPLDSVFHAGSATIEQIAQAPSDDTIVRRLSPRRWAFAWRLEGESAIVGEVQFHERRDSMTEADAALIRLVCSASIYGGGPASAAPREARTELMWPQIERRSQRKNPRSPWLALALLGAATLLAAWLALVAVPNTREAARAQQVEIEQWRLTADRAMVQALSLALAGADYGEVQSSLSSFSALGYFRGAAVVNANERVVAIAGATEGARIGEKLALQSASAARVLNLDTGAKPSGQLLLLSEASTNKPGTQTGALLVAALSTLAATIAAMGLLAWRLFRPGR